jgi:hypothetical protein
MPYQRDMGALFGMNDLALVINVNDGLAPVRAAVFANAVRKTVFPAILALYKMFQRERIMGAAAITPTFRDFPFR